MNLYRIATRIALPIAKFDFPNALASSHIYEELLRHLKIPVNIIEITDVDFTLDCGIGTLSHYRSFSAFEDAVVASSGSLFEEQLDIIRSKYDPDSVNVCLAFHHSVGSPQSPSWLAHDMAHILQADDSFVKRNSEIEYGRFFDVKTFSEKPISKTFDLPDLAIPCLDPVVHEIFNEYESKERPGAGFDITMEPGVFYDSAKDGIQNLMPYFLKTLKPVPPIRRIPLKGKIDYQKVELTPNDNWPEFEKLANDYLAEVSSKFLEAITKEMQDVSDSIPHQRGALVWL